MNVRRAAAGRLAKTELGRRIVGEQRFRMVLTAALGFLLNLLYALYHGMLGVIGMSVWLITMCAYYTVLGTMRLSAVLCERRGGAGASDDTEYFVMKMSGVLLVLLSLVLAAVNYISLSQNITAIYGEITMITIAAYTFYKITVAVIRAVRQRKNPSPLLAVIRTISYAEVAASVLTLQRSMLVSFGAIDSAKVRLMNALTGAGICLFVLMLGIFMTIRGIKKG